MTLSDQTIQIVVGPTAGGKSSYALGLADKYNGVIINADSMQIYDALHVLSAQPPAEDLAQAPHVLYSVLSPAERCTPQIWREMAEREIRKAQNAGQTSILVGGTGLYIKALTEGFSPIPDVPPAIREESVAMQQELGNPAFHEALAAFDPVMAEQLNPNDTQRLVRAWEVFKATGKSLSYWQSLPPSGPPENMEFAITFLNPPREILYERCNQRFDQMLDLDILDEIKTLKSDIKTGNVPADAPITNALGYHPFCDYLEDTELLENATERAKAETRQYAKRQITWFKNQLPKPITEII